MLGSPGLQASGLEATMWEEVESAEGARDEGRRRSRRPSAVPPHTFSLPPSSSASRAEVRGPAASRAAMVEEEAVRPAGARAGSEVLGAATSLRRQRQDRDDEGVCGGVFRPRRWRLALDS
jgi:hypothetical protein